MMDQLEQVYKRMQRSWRQLTPQERLISKSAALSSVLLLIALILRKKKKSPMIQIVAMSDFIKRLSSTDYVEFRNGGVVVAPSLMIASLAVPGLEDVLFKSIIAKVSEFKFVPDPPRVWRGLFSVAFPVVLMYGWFKAVKSLVQPNEDDAISAFERRAALVPQTCFNDVVFNEKRELTEVVAFLNDPEKFRSLGAKLPRGVLLVGPSGSGKTLLARAVAGEANCAFLSAAGSEFVETFVGKGAARVRSLFVQARSLAPCIVFIDELDALGRRDHSSISAAHEEYIHTLNQLLTELDGITGNQGVVVIAATNRFDAIDPALLRPGRFDRHVWLKLPDVKARREILSVHSRAVKIGPDCNFSVVAQSAEEFSGADLANLINEAVFFSIRRGAQGCVNQQDLINALDKAKALVSRREAATAATSRAARSPVLELN
jgi:ATP-dependent metalloprotease FtsH